MELFNGDCLKELTKIKSGSIDLILCDPPYGTVKNLILGKGSESKTQWDTVIDREKMWEQINRVLRVNGICILFGQEPFSNSLINSKPSNMNFCYRLIWEKISLVMV